MVEQAREQVGRLAGSSPREVVFTSGGSEAIAAAVRGVCDRAPSGPVCADRRLRGRALGGAGGGAAGDTAGFVVVKVPCDSEGRVDADGS